MKKLPRIDWTPARVRLLTYGGISISYLVLWATLAHVALRLRPWIELLNGATWPEHAECLFDNHATFYAAVLALRVMLNVSVLWGGLIFIVEYFLIKKGEVMKVAELLSSRELAVLNAVAAAMQVTTVEQREQLDRAAAKAARAWNERYLPRLIGPIAAKRVMETEIQLMSGDGTSSKVG